MGYPKLKHIIESGWRKRCYLRYFVWALQNERVIEELITQMEEKDSESIQEKGSKRASKTELSDDLDNKITEL